VHDCVPRRSARIAPVVLNDLAHLIASNDDNSVAAKCPASCDAAGRSWHAVRVIAVDRIAIRDALAVTESTRVDVTRDGFEVQWTFADMAFPVIPCVLAAEQIAQFFLGRERRAFPVRACVVWIGQRRFWLQYAEDCEQLDPSQSCEVTPVERTPSS
jgi:hypothetical protein